MNRAAATVALLVAFGLPAVAFTADVPGNERVEKDLDDITRAPGYEWLRRRDGTSSEQPRASGPVSEENEKGRARPEIHEDPDADCGYGPAPQDKPEKRRISDKGQGGGCGRASPGSGSEEGGGCERRVGASCEGCGRSLGCDWAKGLPACGCGNVGTVTGYMLGGLLLAVLFVLVVLAISRRSVSKPLSMQSLELDEARPEDVNISMLPEASLDTMLARADAAAAVGDYKTAVGWCYLAGLSALHRLGRIDLRRSTTNREILDTVRRRGGNTRATRLLVQTFEELFFGGREAMRQHYLDCRDVVENQLG